MQPQSVFLAIPTIHGHCSCIDCQHSKLFPPCHNLRPQEHLLKPRTASIITALKSWLTQTDLLGQTKSFPFICTDAKSAFTSAKFIAACNDLVIKLDAVAPEHQGLNGICEAKWRKVHNTANILLKYCPTWRRLLPSCTCLCKPHCQFLPSQECH